jgi:hypothetical protein
MLLKRNGKKTQLSFNEALNRNSRSLVFGFMDVVENVKLF